MFIFIASLLVSIIQFAVAPFLRIGTAVFDLPLTVLIFFSIRNGARFGVAMGMTLGLFVGVFQAAPLLLYVTLYALIGLAAGYLGRWFYKESLFAFILMVFCAFLCVNYFFYIIGILFSQAELDILEYTFRLMLPSVFYTVAVSTFLFYVLKRVRIRNITAGDN